MSNPNRTISFMMLNDERKSIIITYTRIEVIGTRIFRITTWIKNKIILIAMRNDGNTESYQVDSDLRMYDFDIGVSKAAHRRKSNHANRKLKEIQPVVQLSGWDK